MSSLTLKQIAERVQGRLVGKAEVSVSRVADLRAATTGDISFLHNPEYAEALATSNASAVLLREDMLPRCSTNAIVVANPYLAYALVAQMLDATPMPATGISPDASIAASAQIGKSVSVGAGAVIGENVVLGDDVVIAPNCVLLNGAQIGRGSILFPNITIYHQVVIGEHCRVQSGTVIGSDGFGYAKQNGQWVRIPQTGTVRIGDRVEIGANCTIDRGALSDTVIENGVIIDNLVHIAHNVQLGENVAIAGCSGVAGSAVIERNVTLAGRASVIGHLRVCEGTHITACTLVTKSITTPGVYSSGTVQQENREWRKSVARFTQLDDMARRLRALEKQLEQLSQEKKS